MESEASQQPGGSIAFLAWVEVNKNRLLTGGVVGIAVILAVSLFLQQQGQRERAASRAFSEVKLPFNPAAPAPAGTAEALMKVATDYRGTKAAERALLTSAGILFSEKKYAEAEARFAQVSKEYPNTSWAAEALMGVAASLEAQGKTAEATVKYEDLRRRFATSAMIDDAKLALARMYEAQKPEEAFKLYEELAKGQPGTRTAMEAGMRQEDLLKARPELAKLKESLMPPAATPVPVPVQQAASNVSTIRLTNSAGTAAPVQIKLNPTPGK